MSMISDRTRQTTGEDVPSLLATALPDGAVRCGICAHRCLVRPGRAGICGVRENRDGVLYSTAYGAAVAVAMDPIEKKPLFHVAPGSQAYSLATAGCPFHCVFCQNWEIAQGPRLGMRPEAQSLPPDRAVAQALKLGARSIAYTYVEPTVFLEYALAIGRPARAAGLLNLFITDGYATPEAIGLLATILDAANVDLKGFNEAFYRRRCGARLDHVLEALEGYRRAGVWLEVTTLVVPGENDDPAELRELTAWLVEHLGPETPWHVSRFFPAFRMTDTPHRWPRFVLPPRSVRRPACATSTSATRQSWAWRTPTAPDAGPCSSSEAATTCPATWPRTGPAPTAPAHWPAGHSSWALHPGRSGADNPRARQRGRFRAASGGGGQLLPGRPR